MNRIDTPTAQIVFLLHGLGRTSRSMSRIELHLKNAGYEVRNWDYRSTQSNIEMHARKLKEELCAVDARADIGAIHFVTHSLGGIVVRSALNNTKISHIGRIVMLAPPNQGSPVARRLGPLFGKWIRPLPELSDSPDSVVRNLAAPTNLQIGVIAAMKDGKVRVEDTHLPGESDHLIVPGRHTFIMNRADVCAQVVAFLQNGRFMRIPT